MTQSSRHNDIAIIPVNDPGLWQSGFMDRIASVLNIPSARLASAANLCCTVRGRGELKVIISVPGWDDIEPKEISLKALTSAEQEILGRVLVFPKSQGTVQQPSPPRGELKFSRIELPADSAYKITSGTGAVYEANQQPKSLEQIHSFCVSKGMANHNAMYLKLEHLPPLLSQILKDIEAYSFVSRYTDGVVFTPRIVATVDSGLPDERDTASKVRVVGGLSLQVVGLGESQRAGKAGRMIICGTGADPLRSDVAISHLDFAVVGIIVHEATHNALAQEYNAGRIPEKKVLDIKMNEHKAYSNQLRAINKLLKLIEDKGLGEPSLANQLKQDRRRVSDTVKKLA